jgi:predicted ATP-grasp superfamily ATP-dependent carboligase
LPQWVEDDEKTSMETVLLLGNYRLSLAIARQLGRAGHTVIAGVSSPNASTDSVKKSRYVDQVWSHPDMFRSDKLFLASLLQFLAQHPQVSVILPVSELSLLKLTKLADKIPIPLAAVDRATIETCCDKGKMAQIAADLDVPQARFAIAGNLEELHAAAEEVGYPCVARPNDGRNYGVKAYFLENMERMEEVFPHWPDHHESLLVQAHAKGPRYNRYFLAEEGRVYNSLDVRIARTDRADGSGYAIEGVSMPPHPGLDTPSNALVQRLNYTGVGCIQYLVDEDSGQFSFLELNPRLGGNYAFPNYCGLDLVLPMLALAKNQPLGPWKSPGNYALNKRFHWLYGDLIGLMGSVYKREIGLRDALGWSLETCRALVRADTHLTLDWRDLKPSLLYVNLLIEALMVLGWDIARFFKRRLAGLLRG